jgi:4-oxalocrotonate tautomerase
VKAIIETTVLSDKHVWVVFDEVAVRDWYLGQTDVETLRWRKK